MCLDQLLDGGGGQGLADYDEGLEEDDEVRDDDDDEEEAEFKDLEIDERDSQQEDTSDSDPAQHHRT